MRAVLPGRSAADAAGIIDVDQRAVQTWMRRYGERATGVLRDAPRAGWKAKVAQEPTARLARRLYAKNMPTPKKLRRWVRSMPNVTYSVESVRRIIRILGF